MAFKFSYRDESHLQLLEKIFPYHRLLCWNRNGSWKIMHFCVLCSLLSLSSEIISGCVWGSIFITKEKSDQNPMTRKIGQWVRHLPCRWHRLDPNKVCQDCFVSSEPVKSSGPKIVAPNSSPPKMKSAAYMVNTWSNKISFSIYFLNFNLHLK